MRQVPVRELNQHTADVLARVETGERVEITRNGEQVDIIEPVHPSRSGGMIESGELRLALGPLPLFTTSEETHPDSLGLDAVLEDRCGSDR